MFRNPRENAGRNTEQYIPPSVGRPPSPPHSPKHNAIKTPTDTKSRNRPTTTISASRSTTMASTKSSPLPTIGRGSTTPRKSSLNVQAKPKGKPNASILSFFKKAEQIEENLFVQGKGGGTSGQPYQSPPVEDIDNWYDGMQSRQDASAGIEARYNEHEGSVKRQKLDTGPDVQVGSPQTSTPPREEAAPEAPGICSPLPPDTEAQSIRVAEPEPEVSSKRSGPFLEESDSEDDDETRQPRTVQQEQPERPPSSVEVTTIKVPLKQAADTQPKTTPQRPELVREGTSMTGADGFADFGEEDFDEDVFEEGDEYAERRWLEEQEKLEAEFENDGEDGEEPTDTSMQAQNNDASAASCPICSVSLSGVSDSDAAVHVNNCLDGNPTPLPTKKEASLPPATAPRDAANRFRKVPKAPKPAQANPFATGGSGPAGGSAFSKLMSGHAEDAAWAEAAAEEKKSHGKPAFTRTAPFYKILSMPGNNISVDAFRYGAIEGCNAYFLSHFHSDHYIGMTSHWCHGPIYASKVTCNLIRQQIRVDPQYVIPLEWEKKTEIPNTNGVFVTMISANHCPGSSLYLFEKTVGKGNNPKVHRVLHCGDFRACPAHVEHPLLKPDVMDSVSGKTRQQKIDICYLDTTYLNPKYAFPSQEEVFKACADMCVSLSKIQADENDGWEQMKRERAGAGMVKFIRQGSDVMVKKEESEADTFIKQEESDDIIKKEEAEDSCYTKIMSTGNPNAKQRGRLLVVIGTYSIGKERIVLAVARALNSKIYAPAQKLRICRALEDEELAGLLTTNPREAQVHMTPLFDIRAETLDDYLKDYIGIFTRAVGFRPTGWSYRPPNSRFIESPSVQTVLHSDNWKSTFSMKELVPQRGSTGRASCFGVPYSEHSSFRELTMFCCALRIDKIIPTVNVGSAKSREKMKAWCERWALDRKKNGLFEFDGQNW